MLALRALLAAGLLGRAVTIVAEITRAVERARTLVVRTVWMMPARAIAMWTIAARTVAVRMLAMVTMRPLAVAFAVT